jgi:hypothetical protein
VPLQINNDSILTHSRQAVHFFAIGEIRQGRRTHALSGEMSAI